MKRFGGEVEVSRLRQARRDARLRDDGVGLIDVLFAFILLMVFFIPMLKLIPVGSQVVANSADQQLAASLVNSTLQNLAENPTNPPNGLWTNPVSWVGSVETKAEEDGTTFHIYEVEGWCVSDQTPGNGTVSATTPPSYHYVVKVTWSNSPFPDIETDDVVDSVGVDTTSNVPSAGKTIASCPLGLS